MLDPADEVRAKDLRLSRGPQVGHALDDLAENQAELHPGQVGAEAEVGSPATEGDLRAISSVSLLPGSRFCAKWPVPGYRFSANWSVSCRSFWVKVCSGRPESRHTQLISQQICGKGRVLLTTLRRGWDAQPPGPASGDSVLSGQARISWAGDPWINYQVGNLARAGKFPDAPEMRIVSAQLPRLCIDGELVLHSSAREMMLSSS